MVLHRLTECKCVQLLGCRAPSGLFNRMAVEMLVASRINFFMMVFGCFMVVIGCFYETEISSVAYNMNQ